MKKTIVFLILAVATALRGQAAPAETASIDRLLVLAKTETASEMIVSQIDKGVTMGVQNALKGQAPTAADQVVIDSVRKQIRAAVNDTLSWPKLKGLYEKAYADTFSQEEIDGLIAFYSSPTGKAFADKEPLIAQQVNGAVQGQMAPLVMKISPIIQEAMQKLQSAHAGDNQGAGLEQAAAGAVPRECHTKARLPIQISYGQRIALKDYFVTGKTTIFDFYSEYCPPCRALRPLLRKLHRQRDDIAVVKVDINRPGVVGIDWTSPVAEEFGLHSIPHLEIYSPDGTLQSQGDKAQSLVMNWIKALD
jgi:hypothetical protein